MGTPAHKRTPTKELLVSEKLAYQVPEAVTVTGLGRTTLYREMAAGRLESVVVGRRRLIPRAALENYIERLRSEQHNDDNRAA